MATKEWREKNKEHIREYQRNLMAKRRKNPKLKKKMKEAQKRWIAKNSEYFKNYYESKKFLKEIGLIQDEKK